MRDRNPLTSESEASRGISPDEGAVLFNAGVRALALFGFSDFGFDIGGKKSRRRYAAATSPKGERCSIWIKNTVSWSGMADVVRFPWSKRAVQGDDLRAVLFAADDAIRRGSTHLLAIVGDAGTGRLALARLYTLEQIKSVAAEQKAVCRHPFYAAHGAALIIRSHYEAFAEAEAIALAFSEDVLAPQTVIPKNAPPTRARGGKIYRRDAKVRDAVLKMAGGHCESCGQQGFLTAAGERYLETHHIVGVSERGPDTVGNSQAV
jgi:hypothetical protein